MGFLQEFKDFAMKGNVIDLAVGVIIGGAFGKITTALVSDIFMPPLGMLISGINFKDIAIVLKPAVTDAAGKVTTEAVKLGVGNFIQVTIEFILMAFAVFLMVKFLNSLKKKPEAAPAAPAEPPRQEVLLEEIRDLLAKK